MKKRIYKRSRKQKPTSKAILQYNPQTSGASIITAHQILNSNFGSSLYWLLSLEVVNLSGPQPNALESYNKDQMRQHFVRLAHWTLQSDMVTCGGGVSKNNHRINET